MILSPFAKHLRLIGSQIGFASGEMMAGVASVFAQFPDRVRVKVQEFGVASPMKFVALALFIPVVLALAESVSIQSVSLALDGLRGRTPTWTALSRASAASSRETSRSGRRMARSGQWIVVNGPVGNASVQAVREGIIESKEDSP